MNSTASLAQVHPNWAGLWHFYFWRIFYGPFVYVIQKYFRLFLWWSKYETYKTDQTNSNSVHIGLLPCAQQMAPHGGMCRWWRDDNWHPCFSLMGKQSSEKDATKDREGRVKIRVITHAAFTWKKCVKTIFSSPASWNEDRIT